MKTVISLSTGEVAVMTLIGDANSDDCVEKWKSQHPSLYVSHREMPDSAIPVDRTFRSAWTDTTPDPVIDINMEKARAIHMARIRTKRNEELEKLDIEAIKAQDQGGEDTLALIRARKQELRDLPETISPQLGAAESIEEILAIQPL